MTITAVTLLFLGISWQCSLWIGWVAKIQFLPALLALNAGVLVFLILMTLIFGRIYCSVICPLGIMQDGFSWLGGKFRKNRFGHVKEKKWWRYGVLAIFGIALIVGFAPLTTLLAPYSAYGRIVGNLLRPLFDLLHNAAASWDANHGGFHFTEVEIWMRSGISLAIAVLTLVILGVWAWRKGRAYCNTICPVGTFLSLFARFSLFRVRFDKEKCKKCGLCEKNCKACAIDSQSGTVDYSRCVVCGNCLKLCKFDALHYGITPHKCKCGPEGSKCGSDDSKCSLENSKCDPGNSKCGTEHTNDAATSFDDKKNTGTVDTIDTGNDTDAGNATNTENVADTGNAADTGRRTFLMAVGMAAVTASVAQTKLKMDGGLAAIEEKKAPKREIPVTPPGSVSLKHLQRHCTACQLCVSACPNNVLRPSTRLDSLMQPVMSFERGYCRPECTRCSLVCPTGAIKPVTPEDKTAIHAGHAVWIKENCLPVKGGVHCGNCARHCPTGAIQMINYEGKEIPSIDTTKCIGCGACENLCPARPFSAIYVEGNEVHHIR